MNMTDTEKSSDSHPRISKLIPCIPQYSNKTADYLILTLLAFSIFSGLPLYAEAYKIPFSVETAAKTGESGAQYQLGLYYEEKRGDYKEAFKWYGKAAAQKHTEAVYRLGRCYEYGKGVDKDYKKAVEYYRQAADKDHAGAQYRLGCCYEFGRGLTKDYKEALKLYRAAASQSYASAEFRLGYLYERGKGVDKDQSEALRWYGLAAKHGYSKAQRFLLALQETIKKERQAADQARILAARKAAELKAAKLKAEKLKEAERLYQLGKSYSEGQGVSKDEAKAFEYYLKSAELGHAKAQYTVGFYFKYGKDKDYKKTLQWWHRSAEQGYVKAQVYLGQAYSTGEMVKKDYQKSLKWYGKAAAQGDPGAYGSIGACYRFGHGVKQDYKKAAALYHKAAKLGDKISKWALSDTGSDDIAIVGEEVEWYRAVAELGYPQAQCALAYCYLHEKGVDMNIAEAIKWYGKAAKQGNKNAQIILDVLKKEAATIPAIHRRTYSQAEQETAQHEFKTGMRYVMGKEVGQDLSEAFKHFLKAAKLGNPDAQFALSIQYKEGRGIAKDEMKAFLWLLESAEMGCPEAQGRLGIHYHKTKEYAKRNEWLRKAAAKGDMDAQYNLAKLYASGIGIRKDSNAAIFYLRKAARNGHKGAQELLKEHNFSY